MTKNLMLLTLIVLLGGCSKKEEAPPPAPVPAPAPAPVPTPAPAPAPSATTVAPTAQPSAPTAEPSASSTAPDAAILAKGEEVYRKTCTACHQAGIAGAPKIGDKTEWSARIAKGKATLDLHAIKGFTGAKGTMPPKGGNMALSDDDVRAAVDYIVSKAQ